MTSKKVNITVKTEGYYFPRHPRLVWHSGRWWINEVPTKEVYNNGSKSVLYGGTKLGLKKLRTQATKCMIEILGNVPF